MNERMKQILFGARIGIIIVGIIGVWQFQGYPISQTSMAILSVIGVLGL